jgi:DNA-binding FadR family transcriptional regulator
MRAFLAGEAVRLAALYGDRRGVAQARAAVDRAPSLAGDPVAHADNDLVIFSALVTSSAMWPAVWLANVFWGPMREVHNKIAGAVRMIPSDYQVVMERVLDLVEARDAVAAQAEILAFFARIDRQLLASLEAVLGGAARASQSEVSP